MADCKCVPLTPALHKNLANAWHMAVIFFRFSASVPSNLEVDNLLFTNPGFGPIAAIK